TSLLWPAPSDEKSREPALGVAGAAATVVSLGLAGWLAWMVPETPLRLVAYGRNLTARGEDDSKLYMGEGMNSSVAVTELSSGVRNFHVSGKVEASS